MEKGLQFGNLSISLVLLLLLKALTGTSHNSAEGKPGPVAARVETGEDGASAMERGLENVGAAAAFGDVTVEDDENGAAGEEDDTTAESSGDGKLKRRRYPVRLASSQSTLQSAEIPPLTAATLDAQSILKCSVVNRSPQVPHIV
ncbi:UNVERIFIED_CONTAM: hypothetical protein FKN15_062549 [Acipenser sinensis]